MFGKYYFVGPYKGNETRHRWRRCRLHLPCQVGQWWLGRRLMYVHDMSRNPCHKEFMSSWSKSWGQGTHICVGNLTMIGSDNGLSPGRRQAIIWTNAEILLIRTLGTNFSEILTRIQTFSLKRIPLKMSPAKWQPFVDFAHATTDQLPWYVKKCGLNESLESKVKQSYLVTRF